MRPAPLFAAALLASSLAAGAACAQSWDIYSFPDAKFAAQFPHQPEAMATGYRTAAGLDRPARTWASQEDNVLYSLTIADFSGTALDKDAVIADAIKLYGKTGKAVVDVEARINAEYGRELSIKGTDGSRSVVAIFFFDQHLYVLDGRAVPPDPLAASARLIRFQQSLQFLN